LYIIDVSVTISEEVITFPGDPAPRILPVYRMERGDAYDLTKLDLGAHAGTHVDAPSHFIPEGSTADAVPLDVCIGRAFVADLAGLDAIDAQSLNKSVPPEASRILLRTKNSGFWAHKRFRPDFCYLTPDGAQWVDEHDVRLVGIDYLSIETPRSVDHPVHKLLLKRGVVVVEGLNLQAVREGWYTLLLLPLKIKGIDGAPARAVLLDDGALQEGL
jgi:arylformamidase